ncbi:MAG: hydrogenase nickel incorporation protein HypA/HybF [Acetobacteraceae bacterium]|jgi:hydrogenase nickel incorporation protein HypA/HybF|nr:hydrogenase nickel incorporation protein HypA/HybF [Acetobacteraceae bacterium]
MHELSIADGIVEHCAERANGARVLRVRLEIGRLSCVTPDALRFCFDVCAKDTVVEGASLEIVPIQGRARGEEIEVRSFTESCSCGNSDLRVVVGEELRLKEMEVA